MDISDRGSIKHPDREQKLESVQSKKEAKGKEKEDDKKNLVPTEEGSSVLHPVHLQSVEDSEKGPKRPPHKRIITLPDNVIQTASTIKGIKQEPPVHPSKQSPIKKGTKEVPDIPTSKKLQLQAGQSDLKKVLKNEELKELHRELSDVNNEFGKLIKLTLKRNQLQKDVKAILNKKLKENFPLLNDSQIDKLVDQKIARLSHSPGNGVIKPPSLPPNPSVKQLQNHIELMKNHINDLKIEVMNFKKGIADLEEAKVNFGNEKFMANYIKNLQLGFSIIEPIKTKSVAGGQAVADEDRQRDTGALRQHLDSSKVLIDLEGLNKKRSNVSLVAKELDKAFTVAFLSIKPAEFRHQAWSNHNIDIPTGLPMSQVTSPNLMNNSKLWNDTTFYFKKTIVEAGRAEMKKAIAKGMEPDPEKVAAACAKQAEFILDIAEELYKSKNYAASYALFSAVESFPAKVTSGISAKHQKKHDELDKLFTTQKGFGAYESRMHEAKVPLSNVILSRLTFFNENIPLDSAEGSGRILRDHLLAYQSKIRMGSSSPTRAASTNLVKQIYDQAVSEEDVAELMDSPDNIQLSLRKLLYPGSKHASEE